MSASENPSFTANFRYLAASLVGLDHMKRHAKWLDRCYNSNPGIGVNEWARKRQPFVVPKTCARFVEHLRRAGLPE